MLGGVALEEAKVRHQRPQRRTSLTSQTYSHVHLNRIEPSSVSAKAPPDAPGAIAAQSLCLRQATKKPWLRTSRDGHFCRDTRSRVQENISLSDRNILARPRARGRSHGQGENRRPAVVAHPRCPVSLRQASTGLSARSSGELLHRVMAAGVAL